MPVSEGDKMKQYQVQIKNVMVTSVIKVVSADSEVSAIQKARKLFSFSGHEKFILVQEVK